MVNRNHRPLLYLCVYVCPMYVWEGPFSCPPNKQTHKKIIVQKSFMYLYYLGQGLTTSNRDWNKKDIHISQM